MKNDKRTDETGVQVVADETADGAFEIHVRRGDSGATHAAPDGTGQTPVGGVRLQRDDGDAMTPSGKRWGFALAVGSVVVAVLVVFVARGDGTPDVPVVEVDLEPTDDFRVFQLDPARFETPTLNIAIPAAREDVGGEVDAAFLRRTALTPTPLGEQPILDPLPPMDPVMIEALRQVPVVIDAPTPAALLVPPGAVLGEPVRLGNRAVLGADRALLDDEDEYYDDEGSDEDL